MTDRMNTVEEVVRLRALLFQARYALISSSPSRALQAINEAIEPRREP